MFVPGVVVARLSFSDDDERMTDSAMPPYVAIMTPLPDGTSEMRVWIPTPVELSWIEQFLGAPNGFTSLLTAENVAGAATGIGSFAMVEE